jgi:hypothetical protein
VPFEYSSRTVSVSPITSRRPPYSYTDNISLFRSLSHLSRKPTTPYSRRSTPSSSRRTELWVSDKANGCSSSKLDRRRRGKRRRISRIGISRWIGSGIVPSHHPNLAARRQSKIHRRRNELDTCSCSCAWHNQNLIDPTCTFMRKSENGQFRHRFMIVLRNVYLSYRNVCWAMIRPSLTIA